MNIRNKNNNTWYHTVPASRQHCQACIRPHQCVADPIIPLHKPQWVMAAMTKSMHQQWSNSPKWIFVIKIISRDIIPSQHVSSIARHVLDPINAMRAQGYHCTSHSESWQKWQNRWINNDQTIHLNIRNKNNTTRYHTSSACQRRCQACTRPHHCAAGPSIRLHKRAYYSCTDHQAHLMKQQSSKHGFMNNHLMTITN